MITILKRITVAALLTILSVAQANSDSDRTPRPIVTGALMGDHGELRNIGNLKMNLTLDSDLRGFSGSAKYSLHPAGVGIGHFSVPMKVSSQCADQECQKKSVAENIQLHVGWFTFHCVLDDVQSVGDRQHCRFSVPLLLTDLADMTLTWNSAISEKTSEKPAVLEFGVLPDDALSAIKSFDFRYEPAPNHPTLFVGVAKDLRISQTNFIVNWGDPNSGFSRHWDSVGTTEIRPIQLFPIASEQVKNQLAALPPNLVEGKEEDLPVPSVPARKFIFNHWPVPSSNPFAPFPVADSTEQPTGKCPSLSMIRKPIDSRSRSDDPTIHARSIHLDDRCFGSCPSSSYVNLPTTPPTDSEVHFVGVYRSGEKFIRVRVLKTEKPVTLILSSYEPVKWKILAGPEANINTIYLTGNDGLRSEVVGAGLTKVVHLPGNQFAYQWDNENFGDKSRFRSEMTAIRNGTRLRESTFQGRSEGSDFIVPFYTSAEFMKAREQEAQQGRLNSEVFLPDARIVTLDKKRFILYDLRTHATQSLNLQPASENFLPNLYDVVPNTGEVFVALKDGLFNVNKNETFQAPATVPPFNYLSALTYDSKRERFILVGLSTPLDKKQSQYFYAFYPKEKRWKILASHERELILSLVYDPEKDVFYSLSRPLMRPENKTFLWTLSSDLELKSAIRVERIKPESQMPNKLFWTHEGLILQDFSGPSDSQSGRSISTIDPCSGKQWSIVE